jgi:hypothetical protein
MRTFMFRSLAIGHRSGGGAKKLAYTHYFSTTSATSSLRRTYVSRTIYFTRGLLFGHFGSHFKISYEQCVDWKKDGWIVEWVRFASKP